LYLLKLCIVVRDYVVKLYYLVALQNLYDVIKTSERLLKVAQQIKHYVNCNIMTLSFEFLTTDV